MSTVDELFEDGERDLAQLRQAHKDALKLTTQARKPGGKKKLSWAKEKERNDGSERDGN